MTHTDLDSIYQSNRGLIIQQVAFFTRKYSGKILFDDLLGQAHVIFCEAVKSYDPYKAKMTTHLQTQLRRLNDYCRSECRFVPAIEGADLNIMATDLFMSDLCLRDAISKTDDATQELFLYLMSDKSIRLDKAGNLRLPSKTAAIAHMGKNNQWPRAKTSDAWDSLKSWYRGYCNA